MQSAFVKQNLKSGVLTTGTSSSRGGEIVGSLMVAPIGILAGIALPSFVKARNTAQQNACINNLRQIDSAKEQAALAQRWTDDQVVDVKIVNQYIKGNTTPTCPRAAGILTAR